MMNYWLFLEKRKQNLIKSDDFHCYAKNKTKQKPKNQKIRFTHIGVATKVCFAYPDGVYVSV